jgi:SAM-dependent methyltransferase
VVELGCGTGRDAVDIIKGSRSYIGVDNARELLDIAKSLNPDGMFVEQDLATYEIPPGTDVVFAFAALLHVDRSTVKLVLEHCHKRMSAGGIVFLTLKWGRYAGQWKQEPLGRRYFYLYEPQDIERLAAGYFETVYLTPFHLGNSQWFVMALKRVQRPA